MPPSLSKQYRLRPAAIADLEEIWLFSATRWSVGQADEYIHGLVMAFQRIAENPKLVRERDEFSPPVRICAHKSHIIIYRDEDEYVDIIRVRHGHEDWSSELQ